MFRSILVRSSGRKTDRPTHRAACGLARLWAAHLSFLHVRADARVVLASLAAADVVGGAWYGDFLDQFDRDADALQSASQAQFEALCATERMPIGADTPGAAADWQGASAIRRRCSVWRAARTTC